MLFGWFARKLVDGSLGMWSPCYGFVAVLGMGGFGAMVYVAELNSKIVHSPIPWHKVIRIVVIGMAAQRITWLSS